MAIRSDSQRVFQTQILKTLMNENHLLKSQAKKKDALIVQLLEKKVKEGEQALKSERKGKNIGSLTRREDKDLRIHTRIKTLIDLLPDGF
ncbi:unnamed protein product (macronuclear) [Paramecium tetraurelia]|uniref:Uncharacterized protein n=1 Tax=Paramecium tetraurelia TaxID=5888 RepID=A0BD12_PARTE|nr:uncharacterized protein GSPATT00004523001 [Paramecium tetraurelia]CAK56429.1 unnamed protein product [Paramecium tetraurelia]|eukprot:XP_001423827.1 hypothetical protein (macronuclear) [Paramecium tetraurelia strain d4-2]